MKKTAMERLKEENKELKRRLLMVSKLASKTPQFFNPLHVLAAENVRDYVLANKEAYR